MSVSAMNVEADLHVQARIELGSFRSALTFTAPAGTVTTILGPNGSGKTTLLRSVAGLQPLTGGQLKLGGQVLDDPAAGIFISPERRPVGLVFQQYRLFPHLNVRDN